MLLKPSCAATIAKLPPPSQTASRRTRRQIDGIAIGGSSIGGAVASHSPAPLPAGAPTCSVAVNLGLRRTVRSPSRRRARAARELGCDCPPTGGREDRVAVQPELRQG